MRLPSLLVLIFAFVISDKAAHTEECVDLNNQKQTTSLASIEMKRQIPRNFEYLANNLSEKTAKTVILGFSVAGDKTVSGITVISSSGSEPIDQAAKTAVQQAGPFRHAGGCYEIKLSYTPSQDPEATTVKATTTETETQSPSSERGMIFQADKNIRDQIMKLGGGDDTYYYPDTMEGMDIIDDSSGKADVLVFGKKKLSDAKLKPISSEPNDKRIDGVMIDFGEANAVTIFNYFDDSSLEVKNAKPGPGLIEKIVFAGEVRLGFEEMKKRLKDEDFTTIINQDKLLARIKAQYAAEEKIARKAEFKSKPRSSSGLATPKVPAPKNLGPTVSTPENADRSSSSDRKGWLKSVKCKIFNNWKSPSGTAAKLKFLLEIEPSGNLKSATLQSTSGDRLLDEVALQKIKSSAPFRMPPSGTPETVPFSFDESSKSACIIISNQPSRNSAGYPSLPSNPISQMIPGSPPRGGSGSGRTGSVNQLGSPGGGGGRPGIEALSEPDFGPYIAELQRRIRRNWSPSQADRSKRAVAFFKIARDGRLLSLTIQSSSGSKVYDDAGLAAIRASAPFRPLPSEFRGKDIDVQFTFDYDVYQGGSGIRRR